MEAFYRSVGAGLAFAAIIIIAAPLGALFGAFAGWTVQLFWDENILVTLRALGLPPEIDMWDLGAALGFVGSFLRTKVVEATTEKKKWEKD